MKKSKFTDHQILAILKQNEAGIAVAELAREHGISTAMIYQWRSKYGGMDAALMKHLKKVLVIRFGAMGDILMTTPVIRALQTQLPQCEIHVLTKKQFHDLLRTNPHIDKIWCYDAKINDLIRELRKEKFDLIVDLHKNLRSWYVRFSLFNIPVVSFNKLAWVKRLYVMGWVKTLPQKHFVERLFEQLSQKLKVYDDQQGLDFFIDSQAMSKIEPQLPEKYIALVIGSNFFTRTFPRDKWIELIARLQQEGVSERVVLLGGENEMAMAEIIQQVHPQVINQCGHLSIHETAVYLKHAILVVTNDTGLSHLSSAFNKKIISIWGCTLPEFGIYPFGVDDLAIFEVKPLACRPCDTIGKHSCPQKHFKCMRDIDLEAMTQQVIRFSK